MRDTTFSVWRPFLLSALVAVALSLMAGTAAAQNIIKRPGAHPDYGVELEPHALIQWVEEPFGDAGFGLGMRAMIPFVHNGPVPTINNNIGIGFGLDWAHFSEDGCGYGPYGRFIRDGPFPGYPWDCSANAIWLPVYGQWNFFFTDVISVFGEFGFAVQHTTVEIEPCDFGLDCDFDDTDPELIFQGGGRFLFGETAGLIVRIGYPFFTVGASILL